MRTAATARYTIPTRLYSRPALSLYIRNGWKRHAASLRLVQSDADPRISDGQVPFFLHIIGSLQLLLSHFFYVLLHISLPPAAGAHPIRPAVQDARQSKTAVSSSPPFAVRRASCGPRGVRGRQGRLLLADPRLHRLPNAAVPQVRPRGRQRRGQDEHARELRGGQVPRNPLADHLRQIFK